MIRIASMISVFGLWDKTKLPLSFKYIWWKCSFSRWFPLRIIYASTVDVTNRVWITNASERSDIFIGWPIFSLSIMHQFGVRRSGECNRYLDSQLCPDAKLLDTCREWKGGHLTCRLRKFTFQNRPLSIAALGYRMLLVHRNWRWRRYHAHVFTVEISPCHFTWYAVESCLCWQRTRVRCARRQPNTATSKRQKRHIWRQYA